MILAVSLAVAAVFGAGVFLLLQRDLFRVVVGIILISNSAVLFIIAAGLSRGAVPVLPLPPGASASDPLVQAMALTALVIGSSVVALLLCLAYRLYTFRGTVDLADFAEAEARAAEALEAGKEGAQVRELLGDPDDPDDPDDPAPYIAASIEGEARSDDTGGRGGQPQ